MNNSENWKIEYLKRLKSFSVEILHFADSIRLTRTLVPVADQLIRSATSVGANVHEAQGAGSNKDFCHFLQIALKSGRETVYWLEVIAEYEGKSSETMVTLLSECNQINSIIYASIKTMKAKVDNS